MLVHVCKSGATLSKQKQKIHFNVERTPFSVLHHRTTRRTTRAIIIMKQKRSWIQVIKTYLVSLPVLFLDAYKWKYLPAFPLPVPSSPHFLAAGDCVYASQVTLTPPSHHISSYFIRVRGPERIPTFTHKTPPHPLPPFNSDSHEMILK